MVVFVVITVLLTNYVVSSTMPQPTKDKYYIGIVGITLVTLLFAFL